MSSIRFPLWLVLAIATADITNAELDEHQVSAFTSVSAALTEMEERREGKRELWRVPRRDFKAALFKLIEAGYLFMRIDPPSERRGELMPLADLYDLFE